MSVANTGSQTTDATDGSVEGREPGWLASLMGRSDRMLTHLENGVILISYSTLILLIGVETIRRAVTGSQAVWGPEVALYAFVWLSWFSMAKHSRFGTHLAFSEVRRKLPEGVQRFLELLDCAFWLTVGIIIIVTSIGVVENQISMGQTVFGTPIPLAAASLAVPVGWGFSMLRIVQRGWMVLFDWQKLKSERIGFVNL
ncbi:TRAP transporter small permease [Hydrogenophaga sp.]|uniref:TRAP transporter small permease n=1 Tax=Hydrogenophaga sp. TaxID=1904254 RepID=UPI0027202A4A|nr:TRAP transporter small permease [Hydrogenophaga sp.]MDO9131894.1 TRAP transporter small permease [Hydrogenophaga sp.]